MADTQPEAGPVEGPAPEVGAAQAEEADPVVADAPAGAAAPVGADEPFGNCTGLVYSEFRV